MFTAPRAGCGEIPSSPCPAPCLSRRHSPCCSRRPSSWGDENRARRLGPTLAMTLRGELRMDDEDIRWLTFRELATARGIEVASAIRIVRKKNWRRRRSNDGKTVRVAVPIDFLNGG